MKMVKIIAEFCQNHKGDRCLLQEMIHSAAENGASYGKIQSMWVKDLTRRERFELGATKADGTTAVIKRPFALEYNRLESLELSLEDHRWFIEECRKVSLVPFTTVFTIGTIREVSSLPWFQQMVKIASYDCASLPFLQELIQSFDTLFVSTGATMGQELKDAAKVLEGTNFVFFHCVTSYPNTLDNCHLSRLEYLRGYSKEVGWSDHTHVARDGICASKVAIALGANYVERHFTLRPAAETKDGPISVTPQQVKELHEFSRRSKDEQWEEIEEAIPDYQRLLGQPDRQLTNEELLNRDYYRGRFATHKDGTPRFNWETES